MRDITAPDLQLRLNQPEAPLLLDVREPHEYAYASITDSRNIPMNSIPGQLDQLDSAREIVVICHHGIRSRMVGEYLENQGYPNIINLTGGIDAWAAQVDQAMPRY
jgi:rhodanese-related sulfurtransferase